MKELTVNEKRMQLKYVNIGFTAANQNIPEEYWEANADYKVLQSGMKKLAADVKAADEAKE